MLYGVKKKDGELLPLVAHSEVEAFKLAAEIVFGSQSQLSIGKLVMDGHRVVEVTLAEKEGAKP